MCLCGTVQAVSRPSASQHTSHEARSRETIRVKQQKRVRGGEGAAARLADFTFIHLQTSVWGLLRVDSAARKKQTVTRLCLFISCQQSGQRR